MAEEHRHVTAEAQRGTQAVTSIRPLTAPPMPCPAVGCWRAVCVHDALPNGRPDARVALTAILHTQDCRRAIQRTVLTSWSRR